MLSIRKVLEDNGVKIQGITEYVGCQANEFMVIIGEWFVIIKRDGLSLNEEQAIEQACRQYVKENGFKLEWLNKLSPIEEVVKGTKTIAPIWNGFKHLKQEYILKMYLGRDLILEIQDNIIVGFSLGNWESLDWDEEEMEYREEYRNLDKLISWLYANDVKVV